MKKLMMVALAGMLALTGGKALRADAPAVKTEKPAAPAAAPLRDESLAEMLTVMGYEFKAKPIKGTVIYHVTLNQDKLDMIMKLAEHRQAAVVDHHQPRHPGRRNIAGRGGAAVA